MSDFLKAVEQIDGGAIVATTDEKIKEVTASIRRTGKKGSVTVELHFSPNGDRGVAVTGKVKAKAPEVDFGQSFFYHDDKGGLTRTPPASVSRDLLRETS